MAPDPLALLKDGTAEVVPEGGLEEKLALGRPLRVKLGLDPTASDVTLGWAVVLRKLRQFQDAGHIAVLIVGDFTARVGDPSGQVGDASAARRRTRSRRTPSALLEQFGLILSDERLEVRYNSEWLERDGHGGHASPHRPRTRWRRCSSATTSRKRYAEGRPISIMEFLYPLLQGYDSVAVEADIELGGTDQLFNLLVGRDLQRASGQEPQVALTVPLLEGTRRRPEDEPVARQLRRDHRAARRDVRQADADPRRADRQVPAAGSAGCPSDEADARRGGPGGRVD